MENAPAQVLTHLRPCKIFVKTYRTVFTRSALPIDKTWDY